MSTVDRISSSPASILSSGISKASKFNTPALFSSILQSMAQQSKTLDSQASNAVTSLLGGRGAEIHDVIITSQKASLAFELALQVRNKAVAAYQQMAGMQF